MNRRFVSVVVFALVVSAVARVVLYRLIDSRITATQSAPTAKVVVAAHNLEVGVLISPNDLTTTDWTGVPPVGSFKTADDVVGRGVIQPVYAGEAVLDSRLAAKGAGGGLAATIPKGMRAVAVRVNDVVGVSGFISPGTRVDILIAGTPPNGSPGLGTLTKTLLQNIEVASAGGSIQRDAEGKPVAVPVINLFVTPEQAEILSLASNETRIQLVLRNPLDKEIAKPPGTAVANLFSGVSGLPQQAKAAPRPPAAKKAAPPPPPPPPVVVAAAPPPPPPPITIEVFNGTRKTEAKFAADKEAKP